MLIWRPGVSKAVRILAKVEPGWRRRVIYIILGRERAENASPAEKTAGQFTTLFRRVRRCWLFEGAEKVTPSTVLKGLKLIPNCIHAKF